MIFSFRLASLSDNGRLTENATPDATWNSGNNKPERVETTVVGAGGFICIKLNERFFVSDKEMHAGPH